jgi:hypothetical protein
MTLMAMMELETLSLEATLDHVEKLGPSDMWTILT